MFVKRLISLNILTFIHTKILLFVSKQYSLTNWRHKSLKLEAHLSLYHSPAFSCTFVFRQVWCFWEEKKQLFNSHSHT